MNYVAKEPSMCDKEKSKDSRTVDPITPVMVSTVPSNSTKHEGPLVTPLDPT